MSGSRQANTSHLLCWLPHLWTFCGYSWSTQLLDHILDLISVSHPQTLLKSLVYRCAPEWLWGCKNLMVWLYFKYSRLSTIQRSSRRHSWHNTELFSEAKLWHPILFVSLDFRMLGLLFGYIRIVHESIWKSKFYIRHFNIGLKNNDVHNVHFNYNFDKCLLPF